MSDDALRAKFEHAFENPFKIRDKYLDDYLSIYNDAYKPMLMECKTIGEMREVIKQFQFLAWDAWEKSKDLTDEDATRIIELLNQGLEAKFNEGEVDKYASIMLPALMLRARMVAQRYMLPEYYAALQYARGFFFPEKKEEQNANGTT